MGILDNRVVIVTGASSGCGEAVAKHIAIKEGGTVVICARREQNLADIADYIKKNGGKAYPVVCDLTKESDIENVVNSAIREFGQIDALANIGQGGMGDMRFLADVTKDNALEFYMTGPIASMLFMQKCFPHMKKSGRGNIINCASASALMGLPGYASYEMAKEAIRALTRNAAMDWGQYNIVTNCFLPFVMTDAAREILDEPTIREMEKGVPLGYIGKPEECGPIVAFLASDHARYINGQFIGVDGGWRIFA